MPRIFVNYRTCDEKMCAVLIERELSRTFGGANVFLASKSIPPGTRFDERLLRGVWRSDALVAVIGARWLDAPNTRGERALDSAEDWTRREILEAFSHHVVVIPLLVDGVKRLASRDLPAELRELANMQYVRFDHRDPDSGLQLLRQRLVALDGTTDSLSSNDDKRQPRQSGIGSISGSTVNAVTGPRGPVNIGSGHQINAPAFAGDGVTFVVDGTVNEVPRPPGSRRRRQP